MTTADRLAEIRARAEAARQAAASGTTGTPPNVDGLSIHDALDIFAESAEDVPALLDEVERLRRGRNIWRAERDRLAAAGGRGGARLSAGTWRPAGNGDRGGPAPRR